MKNNKFSLLPPPCFLLTRPMAQRLCVRVWVTHCSSPSALRGALRDSYPRECEREVGERTWERGWWRVAGLGNTKRLNNCFATDNQSPWPLRIYMLSSIWYRYHPKHSYGGRGKEKSDHPSHGFDGLNNMSWFIPVVVGFLAIYLVRRLMLTSTVDIKGKFVLITGCDSGFGRETAVRLDKMGVCVLATCLTKQGEESLKSVTSNKLQTFELDVTNSQQVKEVYEEVKRKIPSDAGITCSFSFV